LFSNTWIIQGTNWTCQNSPNEYNQQFSSIRIAEEMATQAIEQFYGQEKHLTIKLDDGAEMPELGGVILIYLMGSNPDDGFLLFVHELLANAGYYKDSIKVEIQTKAILDSQLTEEAALEADLAAHELTQSSKKKTHKPSKSKTPKILPINDKSKEKKPRKPRKKKS
jgi:hypothetical protein